MERSYVTVTLCIAMRPKTSMLDLLTGGPNYIWPECCAAETAIDRSAARV